MKLLRTLGNPFALVAQGFMAGAILFAATHPDVAESVAERIEPIAAAADRSPAFL